MFIFYFSYFIFVRVGGFGGFGGFGPPKVDSMAAALLLCITLEVAVLYCCFTLSYILLHIQGKHSTFYCASPPTLSFDRKHLLVRIQSPHDMIV